MYRNTLYLIALASVILFSACTKNAPVENFEEAERILNNEYPMYTFKNIETLYTEETKKVMLVKLKRPMLPTMVMENL